MSNSYFRFKQFTVEHDRCAMKVGTDGVLLGAWAEVSGAKHILDIGTGTGLIALMAAQRNLDATITGIDIDDDAVCQAKKNVQNSPFSNRIKILKQDILQWNTTERFDAILCNPPFFKEDTYSPIENRKTARSNVAMPLDQLAHAVKKLLTAGGTFSAVIPADLFSELTAHCLKESLYLKTKMLVKTTERKLPKRVLLTFCNSHTESVEENLLLLQNADGSRSADYLLLTRDFYL